MAILMAIGPSGCTLVGQEQLYDPIDQVPPRVLRTLPEDGWIQVPTGMDVRVWFSEVMDPESIHAESVWLFSGEQRVEVSYHVSEDEDGCGLAILRPLPSMIPGVRHRLRITTLVTDLLGNPLPEPVEIVFTTAR